MKGINAMKYILTIVYILFTTGGLTLMKLGGDSFKVSLSEGPAFKMGWITFLGFACYLISFLLWQRMLVKYDLSFMVPIVTGITQIIVIILGYTIFKEELSVSSIIGALVIVVGIVIMTLGKK